MFNSSEYYAYLWLFVVISQVVALLYFLRIIESKSWHLHGLLCVLIAAVLFSASAVVAAIREASQLKVDKRHSEAVPPLSSDDEDFDLSKTEES